MKTLHRAAIKLKKYQNAFRYVFYLCILVLRICCTKYNKTNKLLLKKFNEEYVAHFLRSQFSMTEVGNPENPIWLSNQGHINCGIQILQPPNSKLCWKTLTQIK